MITSTYDVPPGHTVGTGQFAKCRRIMRSENHTINNPEEKQLATAVNPAQLMQISRVEGGYRANGELRRISDGALLATAEGFVGEDEVVWFGGQDQSGRIWPRRHEYAIRAMAQTRAISRVCRSAFAHCVVLIDSGSLHHTRGRSRGSERY
jgi:hypothetical protein